MRLEILKKHVLKTGHKQFRNSLYTISKDSIITSFHLSCVKRKQISIIHSYKNNNGYLRIELNIDGKAKHFSVHRIIAETYIPNPENKAEVNHKNGIKNDNRIKNLEWATRLENERHSIEVLQNKNYRTPEPKKSKLFTRKQLFIDIPQKYKELKSLKKTSLIFNTNTETIREIVNGKYIKGKDDIAKKGFY